MAATFRRAPGCICLRTADPCLRTEAPCLMLSYFSLEAKNPHQMKHALLSLVETPQNNLKICKDGSEVYGSCVQQDLSEHLEDFFRASSNKHRYDSMFLDLVISILMSSPTKGDNSQTPVTQAANTSLRCQNSTFENANGDVHHGHLPYGCVLERVCSAQQLDQLDIENIYPLYQRLQTHLLNNPTDRVGWGIDGPYTSDLWISRLAETFEDNKSSLEYAVQMVKRFLISKTVQDCSIIVALQPVNKGDSEEVNVTCFNNAYYRYSVALVDLDPKRYDKIEQYYKQATEIMHTYQETITSS